jgi:formyl-CoA transferase
VQVAALGNQAANYLCGGKVPQRMGNAHPNIVPYQDFPTADGDMILAIGNDGQFARFCEVAGHAEWATDARFTSNTARVTHRLALVELLQSVTRTRSTAEWIAALEDKAVPCGPINTMDQAFADAQVQHRGLKVTQATSEAAQAQTAVSAISSVASPLRLTATPPVLRNPPPALGEHTVEVLAGLGLDAAQIAALQAARVV